MSSLRMFMSSINSDAVTVLVHKQCSLKWEHSHSMTGIVLKLVRWRWMPWRRHTRGVEIWLPSFLQWCWMKMRGDLHTLATLPLVPIYPLCRRISRLQSQAGHFGGEKNLLSLLGIEPQIVQLTHQTEYTIPAQNLTVTYLSRIFHLAWKWNISALCLPEIASEFISP
jgi:hypothetical protein